MTLCGCWTPATASPVFVHTPAAFFPATSSTRDALAQAPALYWFVLFLHSTMLKAKAVVKGNTRRDRWRATRQARAQRAQA